MPEHRIRLRVAWERLDPSDYPATTRVDLPTVWADADQAGPIQLRRRFGRPKFDPTTTTVDLELADVPGLQAIRLNRQTIDHAPTNQEGPTRIALGDRLEDRNTLELDLVLGRSAVGASWGTIGLVITDRAG